jgi:hypothetical protein
MLQDRLATYANNGSVFADLQRQNIQKLIADKQAKMSELSAPDQQSGVPPAPDKAAIFGPRIETPMVGLNDLKILLPPR